MTPFSFVDGVTDRADHLRDDARALQAAWPQAEVIVLDDAGRALAHADGALCAMPGQALACGPGAATFLGLRGDVAWFAVDAAVAGVEAPNRMELRAAAVQWPAWHAGVFAQARAMQHWRKQHRLCGRCGGILAFRRGGWLGLCQACQGEHYPRTDPAVIVAVGNGDQLLLGRQASWPARRWSVIAGFVEPGESAEQAVAREVLEETGVRVRSVRYLASQPWPFPGSLMLGFIAEAEAGPAVAGDELEQAQWFDADAIRAGLANDPLQPEAEGEGIVLSVPTSIARHLIIQWLATHDAARASR